MEFRRQKSSLSIKRPQIKETTSSKIKTPNNNNNNNQKRPPINRSEDEESPYLVPSTQEMREDVDVLWDYNSPQSTMKKKSSLCNKKSMKRLNLQQSPKVPLKRHLSNSKERIKHDFNKVREELLALKAEIGKPDSEDSLISSPREEENFKCTLDEENPLNDPFEEEIPDWDDEDDPDDPFNDGMDEQLLLASQQIEKHLFQKIPDDEKNTTINNSDDQNNFENLIPDSQLAEILDKPASSSYNNNNNNNNNNLNSNKLNSDKKNLLSSFRRSGSENNIVNNYCRKVEWHRTQSYEFYSNNVQLSEEKLKEIEKNRLEAKAKLMAKIKNSTSSQCTKFEIEEKRLQALAKLELKRQKELIERKKQDALKRREENRRKYAEQVKSSLTTRL